MGRSGAHEYFAYQDEATFLTPPATLARVFGMEQKVSNVNVKRTLLELQELNENTLAKFGYGEFVGTYDLDFVMTAGPWWLSLIFGDPAVSGVGPYTYKYASTGAVPKTAKSFTGENGFAGESANVQRQFLGSIIGSLRMGARLNDFIRCTASCGMGKEPTPGSTLIGSPPKDSTLHPFTYVEGKIEVPDATLLTEVQSFELNLNPNIQYAKGMNDEFAISTWRGLMSMTGRFNLTSKDAVWVTRALAAQELATATFKFSNGEAGASERSLTMKFKDVGIDSHQTGSNPNELKLEDVPLVFRNLVSTDPIVVVNNTSAAPS